MIKLENDELFIYREQSLPVKMNFIQEIFSSFYPWKYCLTSNFIRNYGECRSHPEVNDYKILSSKSLEELSGSVLNFYKKPSNLSSPFAVFLVSNPDYQSSFIVPSKKDSEKYKHKQKGVNKKTLRKFKKYIEHNSWVDPIIKDICIKDINLNCD